MTDLRIYVLGFLCGATLMLGCVGVGTALVAIHNEDKPVVTQVGMCPQEDSCSADYHNGQWHITKELP